MFEVKPVFFLRDLGFRASCKPLKNETKLEHKARVSILFDSETCWFYCKMAGPAAVSVRRPLLLS